MQMDQKALRLSSQILRQCIDAREARTASVVASLVRFEKTEATQFHASKIRLSDFPTGEEVRNHLKGGDFFAYMLFLPGDPVSQKEWQGSYSPQEQAQILMGIPESIIDSGEYEFHLHGIFVSNSTQITFCAAFDGNVFLPMKRADGLFGGTAANLCGIGVSA